MDSKKIFKVILTLAIMTGLSGMIMAITFVLSSAILNPLLFKSYFQENILILMNFIPIFLFMAFIYLVSNRLWLGYLATALIFVGMGLVNKLKLSYRDDPFVFLDLKLVGESVKMMESYDLSLSGRVIMMILILIAIAIGLKIFFQPRIQEKNIRFSLLLGLSLVSIIIFKGYYFDPKVYAEVGDKTLINRWVESQRYQSKGFVYPFIYSIQDAKEYPPEGYDEERARGVLDKNEYRDIPEEKKVNIIAIMLEHIMIFQSFQV